MGHLRHVAEIRSPSMPQNTWASPEELVKEAEDSVFYPHDQDLVLKRKMKM